MPIAGTAFSSGLALSRRLGLDADAGSRGE